MILNKTFCYCNLLILISLLSVYIYTHYKSYKLEGVTNMNCCGGIKAGEHYSESDKLPPRFVRRCFKSTRENGELRYMWNGFPCTTKGNERCCGGYGQCIPSTKGGYCKKDRLNQNVPRGLPGNYIYKRGRANHSSFIPTSNDIDLDLDNSIQMKKYFKKNMDPAELTAREKRYNKQRTEIRNQVTKLMQDRILKKK